MNAAAAEQLARCNSALVVSGGCPPWTGQQTFLVGSLGAADRQVPVEADVSVAELVVVAARAIPRGQVVRADDLREERAPSQVVRASAVVRLEDVIGKEATRAFGAGDGIDPAIVPRPDCSSVAARWSGSWCKWPMSS